MKLRMIRLEARFKAQQIALNIASQALNERLHSMNEWRQASVDRDNTFLLKDVYDTQHQSLGEKVDKNAEDITRILIAKSSWTQAWMIIAAIIAAVGSVVTIFTLFGRHGP